MTIKTIPNTPEGHQPHYAVRYPPKLKGGRDSLNQLYFKKRTNSDGEIRHYWILMNPEGRGLARSYESKERRIESIRDAISTLGAELWRGNHYVVDDDYYDDIVDEGIRLKLIEEVK